MTDLTDIDPHHSLATLESSESIVAWSEPKRKEYCQLLSDRTRVARHVLATTAHMLLNAASEKKFIGEKHWRGFEYHGHLDLRDRRPDGYQTHHVGGRSLESLGKIAQERVKTIMSELPPLQKAVEIIDADTATKIRRLEKLGKDTEPLKAELDELSEDIHMSSHRDMTVGDFLEMVAARESKRQAVISKLNRMSKEAEQIDREVTKKLYAGLPGLAEAIVEAAQLHIDQANALDASMRRIEEQVLFGDSEEALEILRQFENDEAKINSETVASKFRDALDKLKLSVTKGRGRKRAAAKEVEA